MPPVWKGHESPKPPWGIGYPCGCLTGQAQERSICPAQQQAAVYVLGRGVAAWPSPHFTYRTGVLSALADRARQR